MKTKLTEFIVIQYTYKFVTEGTSAVPKKIENTHRKKYYYDSEYNVYRNSGNIYLPHDRSEFCKETDPFYGECLEDNNLLSLPLTTKNCYNLPAICLCGESDFKLIYSEPWVLSAKCIYCGNEFEAYSG